MYQDRDFVPRPDPGYFGRQLIQDLGLTVLLDTMADGDEHILSVCTSAFFQGLSSPDEILYRQAVLRDCMEHSDIIRSMYQITCETIEERRRHYWDWGTRYFYVSSIMSNAVRLLEYLIRQFARLKEIAESGLPSLRSEGMKNLFTTLVLELSDEYLEELKEHLRELNFRDGTLVSAALTPGCVSKNYLMHQSSLTREEKIRWKFAPKYTVPPRDERGMQELARRRDIAINTAANGVAQAADQALGYFQALRTELAFYTGCLNLRDALGKKGEPICFPKPRPAGEAVHAWKNLYDAGLSLILKEHVVGNTADTGTRTLTVITGANQGGKSTFLRSIGQAQIMMECGMFVPAETFTSAIAKGIFTHYKREEDAAMKSGKLDEELERMSSIVDHLHPGSLVLFNESFASTNEREGSMIARQIVNALTNEGVRVFFVTHMYDLSFGLFEQYGNRALFLRADRGPDAKRPFTLSEAGPLPTSYGEDLYEKIFGGDAENDTDV